jgi:uncharacterized protein YdhG (YjbR/CyaY superfamily)
MVLPITSQKPIDLGLQNPDLLPAVDTRQKDLRRERSFGEGSIVGSITRGIFDPDIKLNNTLVAQDFEPKREQLTPEEANKRFGIEGRLQFKTPVSVESALQRKQNVERRMVIEKQLELADQQNTLVDKIGFFFTGDLVGQAVDTPFYAILGPELGAARAMGLSRAIGSRTIANALVKNPVARSAVRSGLERAVIGGAEGLAAQPFTKGNYDYFGLDYGVEDAATDVLFGAGLDVGFNALPVASRLKKAVTRGQYQKQAFRDSINNISTIFSVAEQQLQAGINPGVNMLESMIKLDQAVTLRRLDENNIYHSDFVYRQDFDSLDPETAAMVNERLHTEALIPNDRVQSPERIIELADKQPHRIKSFSDLHQSIIAKADLGSRAIKFSDLVETLRGVLQSANLSKTQFRKFLETEYGLVVKSNRETVDLKKALSIANKIQNDTEISLRKANALDENLFPELSTLKNRLKKLPSLAKLKQKEFIEKFKKARFKVENDPDLNNIKLKDFNKLSPEKQASVLDYLQFLQEGNIHRSEIDELLSGNKEVFALIQERIKWNKLAVDKLTTEQAYDNVRQAMGSFEPEKADGILLEKLDDLPDEINDSFIEEQIDISSKFLTEEELDKIIKEQILEDKVIDDYAEAKEMAMRCAMRKGVF